MNEHKNSWLKLSLNKILIVFGISLAFLIFFALIPPFNYWTFKAKDLSSNLFADYGQFISGFLGTLFSILSFLLLYKTITDQRVQFTKTSFENNFYALLENHRNILNSICDKVQDVSTVDEKGADFFADLAQRMYIDYEGDPIRLNGENVETLCKPNSSGLQRILDIYNYYFHIYNSDLGHYFRNLYHFIKFIDESDVDENTKKRHAKMLRAQLSNYEILLLAYNC